MALFSRSSGDAEATYARVLDGEHLWLAVRGEGPLALRGEGGDVEVPTEVRDGLLTAVVAVPVDGPLTLVAGRKAVPVRYAASAGDPAATHDGRGPLVLESDDGVVVVRRVTVADVGVAGFVPTDDGVAVALDTPAASVSLVVKDRVLADLTVDGERLVLGALPDLPPGTTATFRTAAGPVVRRGNVLARPNFSVLLPPMTEPDVELRWLKDGRLAVHRSAP